MSQKHIFPNLQESKCLFQETNTLLRYVKSYSRMMVVTIEEPSVSPWVTRWMKKQITSGY